MKYIAFIILGLVLLLAICGILVWANMPSAKLTVHAVRPMGTNFYTPGLTPMMRGCPAWEVAITNKGRAPAHWVAASRVKYPPDRAQAAQVWVSEPRDGTLAVGQHTNIYIPGPSKEWIAGRSSMVAWSGGVRYRTPMGPLETRLDRWLTSVPKLRSLLPNSGDHVVYDVWQPITNIITGP